MHFRDKTTPESSAPAAPGVERRAARKLTLNRERVSVLRVATALRTGLTVTNRPPPSIDMMC